ncbi:MAG: hypothetical protein F7C35_08160 [Desulfurococcales archaeon]|nr:hypothetical protein [Desulfurococcales archaeon]
MTRAGGCTRLRVISRLAYASLIAAAAYIAFNPLAIDYPELAGLAATLFPTGAWILIENLPLVTAMFVAGISALLGSLRLPVIIIVLGLLLSLRGPEVSPPLQISILTATALLTHRLMISCEGKKLNPVGHGVKCGGKCVISWILYELTGLGLVLGLAIGSALMLRRLGDAIERLSAAVPPDTRGALLLLSHSPTVRVVAALILLAVSWLLLTSIYPVLYTVSAATPRGVRGIVARYVSETMEKIRKGKEWHIRVYIITATSIAGYAFGLATVSTWFFMTKKTLSTASLAGTFIVTLAGSALFYIFLKRFLVLNRTKYLLGALTILILFFAAPALLTDPAIIWETTKAVLTGGQPAYSPLDDKLMEMETFQRALEEALRVIVR